jgi:hypothetical protein
MFKYSKSDSENAWEIADYTYHGYCSNHIESTKANTLFQKIKFGSQTAFLIVFEMTTSGKRLSNIQAGKRYKISKNSLIKRTIKQKLN